MVMAEEYADNHREPEDLDHVAENDDVLADDLEEEMEPTLDLKCDSNDSEVAGLFSGENFSAVENINIYPKVAESYHQQRYRLAWDAIKAMRGVTIVSGVGNDEIAWTVIESCDTDHYCDVTHKGNVKQEHDFFYKKLSQQLIMLWPGDIWRKLDQMNLILRKVNETKRLRTGGVIREVSKADLLTFLALLIGACNQPRTGRDLWERDSGPRCTTLTPLPNFQEHMSCTRFAEIRSIVPLMMQAEGGVASSDAWWKVRQFVDGYNTNRQRLLNSSAVCVLDESMIPFKPR